MALNKTQSRLLEDSIDFQEESSDNFQEGIPDIQKSMFRQVLLLVKELDVDRNGNIKNTVANRRKVQRFKKIRNKIITPRYEKDVEKFLKDFDKTKQKTDKYIDAL